MASGKQDAKSLIKSTRESRKAKVKQRLSEQKKTVFFTSRVISLCLVLILSTRSGSWRWSFKKEHTQNTTTTCDGWIQGVASGLDIINWQDLDLYNCSKSYDEARILRVMNIVKIYMNHSSSFTGNQSEKAWWGWWWWEAWLDMTRSRVELCEQLWS